MGGEFMTATQSTEEFKGKPIRGLVWLLMGWAALVALVLIWQAYTYTGFFAWLAERQFALFDMHFPAATILLLIFLLSLPIILLILLRLSKRRRKYGPISPEQSLDRNRIVQKWLVSFCLLSLIVAGGLALTGYGIGAFSEKPTTRLMFEPSAQPSDGYVEARTLVLTDRLAFYRQGTALSGRKLLVAPVVRDADDKNIKYFLKIAEQEATPARILEFEGFLKEEAVPGGLAELYRNAGYSVADQTFIIFEDHLSARWIWYSYAISACFGALFFLLGYLVVSVFNRRVKKQIASVNPSD